MCPIRFSGRHFGNNEKKSNRRRGWLLELGQLCTARARVCVCMEGMKAIWEHSIHSSRVDNIKLNVHICFAPNSSVYRAQTSWFNWSQHFGICVACERHSTETMETKRVYKYICVVQKARRKLISVKWLGTICWHSFSFITPSPSTFSCICSTRAIQCRAGF